ncbi:MAG: DUF2085 domain-containing protein [Anaerolineaceae bacterium]|nr:DUF2085 domain-containing protein [Anaerolineaceae bacterium]
MKKSSFFILISLLFFIAVCQLLQVWPDRLSGAAFCHQIPDRSPAFGFPLCYRCSGLFFGIFWGLLLSPFTSGDTNLFSKKKLLLLAASVFLYLADIFNSSKFPGFHIYRETVNYRFLSSFPLGYMLSQMIFDILRFLFGFSEKKANKNGILRDLFMFIVSCCISYLCVFSSSYIVSIITRTILCLTTILFTGCLYTVMINCFLIWRNRKSEFPAVFLTGLACSLLQISIIGFLHLRFLPFDKIL